MKTQNEEDLEVKDTQITELKKSTVEVKILTTDKTELEDKLKMSEEMVVDLTYKLNNKVFEVTDLQTKIKEFEKKIKDLNEAHNSRILEIQKQHENLKSSQAEEESKLRDEIKDL